jgi:hypothetical protein
LKVRVLEGLEEGREKWRELGLFLHSSLELSSIKVRNSSKKISFDDCTKYGMLNALVICKNWIIKICLQCFLYFGWMLANLLFDCV